MKTPKRAIVAGASGLTGSHLIEQLLKADYSEIIVTGRNKISNSDKRLFHLVVDFENLKGSMQYTSADDAFCCLGTTLKKAGSKQKQYRIDHDYVVEFAKMCLESGVKRFAVVSSIGANLDSSNFYLKMKAEMEEDLKKIPFEALFIFRPSLLLGKRNEIRLAESFAKFMMFGISPFLAGNLKKFRGIHAKELARSMIMYCNSNEQGIVVIESDKIITR